MSLWRGGGPGMKSSGTVPRWAILPSQVDDDTLVLAQRFRLVDVTDQ